MRRLSYPLSTIILIETTFSSVEGVTTPTLKNALSILPPVYHHTHIDNTFSSNSIEGGTTPKLKNVPSILSSLSPSLMSGDHHYTHIDNTFSSVEGATTPTLKNAPSILSPLCSSLWRLLALCRGVRSI